MHPETVAATSSPRPPDHHPPPSSTGWHDGAVVDGVAVLRWPEDAAARLDVDGVRLLLVADEAPPPLVWGEREDWARTSASPTELRARVDRLAARLRTVEDPSPATPVLDADGVLHVRARELVVIPPVESRILARLLDRVGRVVRRDDLVASAWPDGPVGARALDGRMRLLRRRIAGRGLTIHTVRGTGFLLTIDP